MKKILLTLSFFMAISGLWAQRVGVKTNLAHWAAGATPNAGIEFPMGQKYTLELGGGYNWFAFSDDAKRLKHWIVQPELRYWFCERFNGHFLGLHALGMEYNVGGIDVPLGRLEKLKDHRYEGYAAGAGISYGYQRPISSRFSFELNIGVGYAYLTYDKYPCVKCGEKMESGHENYLGVTKAAVSLIYLFE